MELLQDTLRGIATQRRAVPVALVCLPMVLLEGYFAGPRGAMLAIAIFAGFLSIGPVSYRALFHARGRVVPRVVRVVAFAAITLGYVLGFGVALPRLMGVFSSILTDPITLYSAGPLFWAGSWALGGDIEWEARLAAAHARNDALAREAERAQLLALRTHLDPHFLFNTLNAIAEWCRDEPAVAERAMLQLSGMLRTILTGVRAKAWPLADELELVRQLLELYQARDPERFAFELEASPDAELIAVPPMLLLSLVENAVKHGPAAGCTGAVVLRASAEPAGLRVEIRNPGAFRGPRPDGEGLRIVEKRLQLAYDGKARMSHQSDADSTTVRLDLPRDVRGDAV